MRVTRREFLRTSAATSLGGLILAGCTTPTKTPALKASNEPWYRRTLRWGQTNITEADPANYDLSWWRTYWKRTAVQGIIVNAGGIVAYYPSKEPLQFRPDTLGRGDLFGEIATAAREEGLVLLARMDSNRAHENFYNAHPDWFALDVEGRPRKAGELFIACVNSPYYAEYLPGIFREIIERYHPEGFADNSWSGLGRDQICYCENCRKGFRDEKGQDLPAHKNWDDAVYRDWILWNYQRRTQLWDQNNQVTRAGGGQHCLWIGMNSGSIVGQCQNFRDYREICSRAELLLLDHQARSDSSSASENADVGQLIHGMLGWEKLIPESMAMYQAGRPTFRKSAKPKTEAQLWMLEGIAGGLQPWWHHVGAQQEDQRQFQTAEPIYLWHRMNEEFLVNREPVASVALLWSQRNTDFFGRDHAQEQVELPFRGWTEALTQARIPYLPMHVDDLDTKGSRFSVLIAPNIGALSDVQAENIRRLVQRGCSLVATGRTSLYDEWGQPRSDFALADLLGAHYLALGREHERPREILGETQHTYLRIEDKSAAGALNARGEFLAGFDGTEILPFDGWLGDVIPASGAQVVLTYIPPFPIYPPETSWMHEPRTHVPGLIVNSVPQAGKVTFLIADLDRRYAMDGLPDHGRVLANLIRWAADGRFSFAVEGPGMLDCRLYRQSHRLILHLVNLTGVGAPRGPLDEVVPVGPLRIRIPLSPEINRRAVRTLVSRDRPKAHFESPYLTVTLPSVGQHEMLVVG